MSFGFRLFEVTLHDGQKSQEQPFTRPEPNGWNVTELVERLWTNNIGHTLYGLPRIVREELGDSDPDAEGVPQVELRPIPKPVFRVEETGWVGRHPYVEIYYGRAAGHTRAIPLEDTDADDADISGHAPARRYLAYLCVTTNHQRAVLAVESYGRACPVEPVRRWLNSWLMEFCRASEPAASNQKPNRRTTPRWQLRVKPLGDAESLKGVIHDSRGTRVVLERHELGGRQVRDFKVTLSAPIKANTSERVRETMRSWFEQQVGGTAEERATQAEATQDVAALLGPEIAAIDFDDGWVVVEDEYGASTKVSPDRMSDVFTYKVAEWGRPGRGDLQRAIRNAVLRIMRSRELQIDWDQW